mmetsp:Transcript_4358/g.4872  ORF Transcript_4358/g.4872 Transcript_4358/m.4872 type:complete len:91 (-) Transcript_4358:99-371(-)
MLEEQLVSSKDLWRDREKLLADQVNSMQSQNEELQKKNETLVDDKKTIEKRVQVFETEKNRHIDQHSLVRDTLSLESKGKKSLVTSKQRA